MNISVVFLAVLGYALAQTTTDEAKCREGWDVGLNSCYKVINMRTHWIEAWTYCAVMRSYLVEIESQEEQDTIAAILKEKYSNYYEQFWTGMTDLDSEGVYQWMRFKQNATYFNWVPGQPDNDHGRGEHCIHINAKPARAFRWNDHKCNANLNFICEDAFIA